MTLASVSMRRVAPAVLVALTLAWSAGCRAGDVANAPAPEAAPVAPVTPAPGPKASDAAAPGAELNPVPSNADTLPRARVPRPHGHPKPGQGIDQSVHRLTVGLGLDNAQQARLREILWDEQRQMLRLRQNPGAGVDWASATATIIDQTKARIRAMLNDEQKKKYSVDVPRDGLGPAQADLQHWMQLQDSKRMHDAEASK